MNTFENERLLTLWWCSSKIRPKIQIYNKYCKPIYSPRQNYWSIKFFLSNIDPYGYNCHGNRHCFRRKKLSQTITIFKAKMLPEGELPQLWICYNWNLQIFGYPIICCRSQLSSLGVEKFHMNLQPPSCDHQALLLLETSNFFKFYRFNAKAA